MTRARYIMLGGFLGAGKTTALMRLAEHLEARGAKIRRYRKPTFTKPAPADLRRQIASECSAVVEALAD